VTNHRRAAENKGDHDPNSHHPRRCNRSQSLTMRSRLSPSDEVAGSIPAAPTEIGQDFRPCTWQRSGPEHLHVALPDYVIFDRGVPPEACSSLVLRPSVPRAISATTGQFRRPHPGLLAMSRANLAGFARPAARRFIFGLGLAGRSHQPIRVFRRAARTAPMAACPATFGCWLQPRLFCAELTLSASIFVSPAPSWP
jgi:hypothetical protein